MTRFFVLMSRRADPDVLDLSNAWPEVYLSREEAMEALERLDLFDVYFPCELVASFPPSNPSPT